MSCRSFRTRLAGFEPLEERALLSTATLPGDPGDIRQSFAEVAGPFGAQALVSQAPVIEISEVPPYGSDGLLRGVVSGVDPATHRVATYIYVDGSGWWTKPSFESPTVPIHLDGSFTVDVVTGGLDAWATIYCTAIVPASAIPPPAEGAPTVPDDLGSMALATDFQERYGRTLEFAGYTWAVKEAPLPVGPGLNRFSSSPSDVWVDNDGLHLTIHDHDGYWWSSEVILLEHLGYGTYSVQTDGRNDTLDANATFGAFTWDSYGDDPAIPEWPNREIDIEDSRWGDPADPLNSQFVVQPWYLPGHRRQYPLPDLSGDAALTRTLTWEPQEIDFVALLGHQPPEGYPPGNVVDQWTYTHDPGAGRIVPETGREQFRFNLWLNGSAPAGGLSVEVVVTDFAHFAAGGPYAIAQGQALSLDAGDCGGPGGGNLTYAWDLDDDGQFDDAAGVAPLVSWDTLAALGLAADGTPLPVRVQVSDSEGRSAVYRTTLTITVPEPLGGIDLLDQALPGNSWYRLQTVHDAILTLEAPGADAQIELFDEEFNRLAAGKRVDWPASDGQTFYFHLGGQAENAEVRIANLVARDGATVLVYGTAGDDPFVFDASGTLRQVSIHGVAYEFTPAEATSFEFSGAGGSDDVQFAGSAGNETAELRPGRAALHGDGYMVTATDVESARFEGGAGKDTVFLHGGPGADIIWAGGEGPGGDPHLVAMSGNGVALAATAEVLYAYGHGGYNKAYLRESMGDDVFQPFWRWSRMWGDPDTGVEGDEYYRHVIGFEDVSAYASQGDGAVGLQDSAGDASTNSAEYCNEAANLAGNVNGTSVVVAGSVEDGHRPPDISPLAQILWHNGFKKNEQQTTDGRQPGIAAQFFACWERTLPLSI